MYVNRGHLEPCTVCCGRHGVSLADLQYLTLSVPVSQALNPTLSSRSPACATPLLLQSAAGRLADRVSELHMELSRPTQHRRVQAAGHVSDGEIGLCLTAVLARGSQMQQLSFLGLGGI